MFFSADFKTDWVINVVLDLHGTDEKDEKGTLMKLCLNSNKDPILYVQNPFYPKYIIWMKKCYSQHLQPNKDTVRSKVLKTIRTIKVLSIKRAKLITLDKILLVQKQ